MEDLIYSGDENYKSDQTEILKWFPNAIFTDASDCIHEGRFSVKLEDTDKELWQRFLISSGLGELSLGFQLETMAREESCKEITQKMAEYLICLGLCHQLK